MTIIKKEKGFKIEFDNREAYYITDNNGDVWYRVNTLRKAENKLKGILSCYI